MQQQKQCSIIQIHPSFGVFSIVLNLNCSTILVLESFEYEPLVAAAYFILTFLADLKAMLYSKPSSPVSGIVKISHFIQW